MLRLFTLALLGLVSTAAVVSAGDHCFVNGGGAAPIVVGGGYGGPVFIQDSRQFFSQPRPIIVDRRPIVVNNGGRRQRFVNGGGGNGPVVNIIDAVGRVANSPAGTFVLGALAGGGAFR